MKIASDYYLNEDTLFMGQDLLGKYLMTSFNNELTGGIIIETESYLGVEDRASHAFNNRRTKRNEVMYAEGGHAYVFRCYGIHALFNVVTSRREIPHAILIRAIKPVIGIETMLKRRKKSKVDSTLSGGPGTLTQALGIDLIHNGLSLSGCDIWLENREIAIEDGAIKSSPRIGIDYAGEDALKPWRFNLTLKE
ncbi:putative 3-methyladenine DNA glycosylase [Chlamydiales bacterium STE3]|nr:putative 3-methyladenine DNA glycosylase [Chlamydiales bacterium STE3]